MYQRNGRDGFRGFSYMKEKQGKNGNYLNAWVRVGRMIYKVSKWDDEGSVSFKTSAGRFYFPVKFMKSKNGESKWCRVQAGSVRVSVILKEYDKGLGCKVIAYSFRRKSNGYRKSYGYGGSGGYRKSYGYGRNSVGYRRNYR